jgi:uncharacterized surface protein with fasciclin (FAS1) repeats
VSRDDAFDKLPAGTLGKLLLPQNNEQLRSLLLFHVVSGKVLAADLKSICSPRLQVLFSVQRRDFFFSRTRQRT